ncbi:MAG: hypothetical protein K2L94_04485 [Alphaproteobacteria bacterium]|nr:hypothetical protein [Alphaproteobacteria bacterium]
MANNEYQAAIERINRWADDAVRDDDKILARELQRAREYLEKNYNKLADATTVQNREVMSHYNKLVEIAMRHSDERSRETSRDHMNIVNAMLERGAAHNK